MLHVRTEQANKTNPSRMISKQHFVRTLIIYLRAKFHVLTSKGPLLAGTKHSTHTQTHTNTICAFLGLLSLVISELYIRR
jgi:hypothetical protein